MEPIHVSCSGNYQMIKKNEYQVAATCNPWIMHPPWLLQLKPPMSSTICLRIKIYVEVKFSRISKLRLDSAKEEKREVIHSDSIYAITQKGPETDRHVPT